VSERKGRWRREELAHHTKQDRFVSCKLVYEPAKENKMALMQHGRHAVTPASLKFWNRSDLSA
jgi:hypothetical protein